MSGHGDRGELEGHPDRLGDVRVGRHPDVVVEADELPAVRVEQVEVGERHDHRGDHRTGREQHEPDEPRSDEDVAPDASRVAGGHPPSASADTGRGRGEDLGRLRHGLGSAGRGGGGSLGSGGPEGAWDGGA